MTEIGAPDVSGTGDVAESVTPSYDNGPDTSESSGGGNPAWKPFLDVLPSQLHPVVTPVLKDWDKGVQSRFSEVQSRFAPYQQFADDGVSADDLTNALTIMQQIEADPRSFYDQMAEYFADEWGQGQQGQPQEEVDEPFQINDDSQFDITQHPKFQEQQESLNAVTEYLAGTIEQQRMQQIESELETQLTTLKEQHGDFDEEVVFSLAMAQDIPLDQAVGKYMEIVNNARQAPRADANAPQVLSPRGGGSVPITSPDPAKMDNKQTRNLVAQILAQAHQE